MINKKISHIMLNTGIALTCILTACTPGPGKNAPDAFIIISIDALRPDALSPERTPVINTIISKGLFTEGRSVNPPKTLIAHTALFTGLSPEQSGKTDNSWREGDDRIKLPTIFSSARSHGLITGYFYSKEKLGYLVNDSVKKHALSEEYSIDEALNFIRGNNKTFTFLHISGLEYEGMDHGWMSKEYLDRLSLIDKNLKPVLEAVFKKERYTIIITSDHGGHARLHGTDHADDYRIPFIIYSNQVKIPEIKEYRITDLKGIIEKLLEYQ